MRCSLYVKSNIGPPEICGLYCGRDPPLLCQRVHQADVARTICVTEDSPAFHLDSLLNASRLEAPLQKSLQRSIVLPTTMAAMAGSQSSNLVKKHSRSRAACKQCRQAKVRCGMEKMPCARCERRGLACAWDPGFKRSNNPDRFRHLEGHLRALEQKVGSPAFQPPPEAQSHVQTSAEPTPDGPVSHSAVSGQESSGRRATQTPRSHGGESPLRNNSYFKVLDIKLSRDDAEGLFAL